MLSYYKLYMDPSVITLFNDKNHLTYTKRKCV